MEHTGRLPLYLVPSAPEFDYNRRDLPPSVQYVGPCLWHRPSGQAPAPWLQGLGKDRPVVHVTEGTIHVKQPVVLHAAAQGLGNAAMDVVMTSGNHRAPDDLDLGPRAPNIRVERYVSHGDLFPVTDVVVTTGGAGTVLTALSLGVPLVVVPTGWDLPENAQRVVEAGAGIRIHPRHCTPQRMRAAVDTILSDPSYKQNAQRLAAAFAREGGPPRAARLLERLLTPAVNHDVLVAEESIV
jgi:MGT family glycosyltransferase